MIRYRSLWLLTLLTVSLMFIYPHSAITAPLSNIPSPSPTALSGDILVSEIPQSQYPGIIYAALAILGVIIIGNILIRLKNR